MEDDCEDSATQYGGGLGYSGLPGEWNCDVNSGFKVFAELLNLRTE